MLIRKTTLLAKVETTYGTDATPTPEANAILCKKPRSRATGEELVRDNVRSTLGPLAHVIGEKYGEVEVLHGAQGKRIRRRRPGDRTPVQGMRLQGDGRREHVRGLRSRLRAATIPSRSTSTGRGCSTS
jgi:DNA/RNA endonuclease YhcR with UshA esterase domain